MKRMSAQIAKIALSFVFARDGLKCNNGKGQLFINPNCLGDTKPETLILDHVDNDPTNNNPSNWQALCRSCNTLKDPRSEGKRGKRVRDRLADSHNLNYSERGSRDERERVGEGKKTDSLEFEKGVVCESKYRGWLVGRVLDYGFVPYRDSIDGGAEIAGCSQQAVERYLRKLCSIAGPLSIEGVGINRRVVMKPEYIPRVSDDSRCETKPKENVDSSDDMESPRTNERG